MTMRADSGCHCDLSTICCQQWRPSTPGVERDRIDHGSSRIGDWTHFLDDRDVDA
jgi:hypothetical protein